MYYRNLSLQLSSHNLEKCNILTLPSLGFCPRGLRLFQNFSSVCLELGPGRQVLRGLPEKIVPFSAFAQSRRDPEHSNVTLNPQGPSGARDLIVMVPH